MKNNFLGKITYVVDGKVYSEVYRVPRKMPFLSVKAEVGEKVVVTIRPEKEITLQEVSFSFRYDFQKEDRVFLNGYQSWTDSKEMLIDGKMPGLSRLPKKTIQKHFLDRYGDYNFVDYPNEKGNLHGFTYAYVRRGDIFDFFGSLDERSGFTQIRFDCKKNIITVVKDCKGLVIDSPYTAFKMCHLVGYEDEVFRSYFRHLKVSPKTKKQKTGYTSWYDQYEDISEAKILTALEGFKNYPHKCDIFQIDDGYETAVGDWLSVDSGKFPNGMEPVIADICRAEMVPGIWLAPFVAERESAIFHKCPDWFVKDENGEPVCAGNNWSGFYALDIENENVRKYLKTTFRTMIEKWGVRLFKLDFLYAACIIPNHNKTRGQLMYEAIDFLTEICEGAEILACGVPLAPVFGRVEYCRIGCDVSLDWDDKLHMRLIHRERTSTKNSVLNTVYRRQLNGRAFLNDPDVFLLRGTNNKLKPGEKAVLAAVNGLFGGLLLTSDNIGEYSSGKQAVFEKMRALHKAEIISIEREKYVVTLTYQLKDKEEIIKIPV